ncbi:MAG TPA: group I intron-associated PD-(D/E)XK endonuclease [Pyrinomonadaceae bacterium]|nr:group I intron-associated PD-(D/E)XK endonuclease [Pyrinomonadaceae bacterium]
MLSPASLMHSTHQKGEIAQLKVQLRAAEKGVILSKPLIDMRYDFILDDGHRLERVQVKYAGGKAQNSQGSVKVNLKSWEGRKLRRRYCANEVDALLVYIPQIDKVLRFEAGFFCERESFIVRIQPAKNGQTKGTLRATDFVW